jgi:uridine monophosphate synthetase
MLAQRAQSFKFDVLAAIPYAALPIGVVVSLTLIDDLITKGQSKLEAIALLEDAGLKVKDILVLVDREQGGVEGLDARGYTVHSVLILGRILDALVSMGKLAAARRDEVKLWLMENR